MAESLTSQPGDSPGAGSDASTEAVPEFNPFVVFGSSKSGTTWVQRICDSHRQVRCHFQRPILPIDANSHPHLFAEVIEVLRGPKSPFRDVFENEESEARYHVQQRWLAELPLLRADYVRQSQRGLSALECEHLVGLHGSILRGAVAELLRDVPGMEVYGTKAYTDLELLFGVFPKAKLIHIVRDGRDVCVSRRFHSLREGVRYLGEERYGLLSELNRTPLGRHAVRFACKKLSVPADHFFVRPGTDGPLLNEKVLRKYAVDWSRLVSYILSHQRQRPEQCLMVRYEDLLRAPKQECHRMFEFLEVDTSDSELERIVSKTRFSQMQRSSSQSSFFRKGAAGSWQNHFGPSERKLFKQLAGRTLIELGYEATGNW